MMPDANRCVQTPLGVLRLTERDGALIAVGWAGDGCDDTPLLRAAEEWVCAYFAGDTSQCTLPMQVNAPPHVRAVCQAIHAIPFGETRSYGDIAGELGLAAQSVGQACGANPLPVLIPCHRVLGANGLGGYSGDGGVETKVALLRHEGAAGLLI